VSLRLVRPEVELAAAPRPSIEGVVYRDGRCYASLRWLKLGQMHATEQPRKASGPLSVDLRAVAAEPTAIQAFSAF